VSGKKIVTQSDITFVKRCGGWTDIYESILQVTFARKKAFHLLVSNLSEIRTIYRIRKDFKSSDFIRNDLKELVDFEDRDKDFIFNFEIKDTPSIETIQKLNNKYSKIIDYYKWCWISSNHSNSIEEYIREPLAPL